MKAARRQIILTSASIAAVATLATGGLALASDTHHHATSIHACVNRTTGVIREAMHCKDDENALVWNVQGPPGPRGSAGPAAVLSAPGHRPS